MKLKPKKTKWVRYEMETSTRGIYRNTTGQRTPLSRDTSMLLLWQMGRAPRYVRVTALYVKLRGCW